MTKHELKTIDNLINLLADMSKYKNKTFINLTLNVNFNTNSLHTVHTIFYNMLYNSNLLINKKCEVYRFTACEMMIAKLLKDNIDFNYKYLLELPYYLKIFYSLWHKYNELNFYFGDIDIFKRRLIFVDNDCIAMVQITPYENYTVVCVVFRSCNVNWSVLLDIFYIVVVTTVLINYLCFAKNVKYKLVLNNVHTA